jgi:hypothetical protein
MNETIEFEGKPWNKGMLSTASKQRKKPLHGHGLE